MGWHQRLDMEWDPVRHRFMLKRDLLPGSYPYKWVAVFFAGGHTGITYTSVHSLESTFKSH